VRLPNLGFRCARTLHPRGACDTDMPEVPPECRPGAHHRDRPEGLNLPACEGPDFRNAPADAAEGCEPFGDVREASGECTRGLTDYCSTDEEVGCGAFTLSTVSLPEALRDSGWRPRLARRAPGAGPAV